MKGQGDIFGGTQALDDVEPPRYMQRDAGACEQSRLFEPQMEGQLALETERPASAGRADTTTEEDGNSHG